MTTKIHIETHVLGYYTLIALQISVNFITGNSGLSKFWEDSELGKFGIALLFSHYIKKSLKVWIIDLSVRLL